MDSIYDIPEEYEKAGVSRRLCDILGIRNHTTVDLKAWKRFVRQSKNTGQTVKIAVVGKYFNSGDFILSDVYISILEAIKFSAYKLGLMPQITYLSAADFTDKKQLKELKKYAGTGRFRFDRDWG